MSKLFSIPGESAHAQKTEEYRSRLLELCGSQCPPSGEAVWLDGVEPADGEPARLAGARLTLDPKFTPMVAANMIEAAAGEAGVDVFLVGPTRVDGLVQGRATFLLTSDTSGPKALGKVAKSLERLAAMPRDSDGYRIS